MASFSEHDVIHVGDPLSSQGLYGGLWTIAEAVWTP